MIPYYILIGAPLLFSLRHALSISSSDRLRSAPVKNYTIVIFFFLYFLLLALRRWDIGIDLAGYIRSFNRFGDYTWNEAITNSRWEIGFVAFTKFISILTHSPQIYIAIIAGLCVFPVARLYYRESEDDITAMALFMIFPVFIMNFSGLRQAVAIAFAPAVYQAARDRKLWRAVLLSFLAMTFHTSGIVLLLVYPVCRIKLQSQHLFLILPLVAALYLFSIPVYYFLLPLLGEDYASRYTTLTQTNSTAILFMLLLFTLYAFLLPDDSKMDETTDSLRNLLVLALFIQVFASISHTAMRINYFFVIFIPLLIPRITARITRIDRRYVQLIQIGMASFFLLYHFIKIHYVDSLHIYPYAFFWQ